METRPSPGDIKVFYVPQLPMPAFEVQVNSVDEGRKILDVLQRFSNFEYEHRVKPDYSDVGGVVRYEDDGNGGFDWFDVDDDE